MAWQLIAAAAAPYVAKGIGQALNKPKEEDFKPQTKYMEKYLSHLKGITTNREAQHLAMQPALRTIGAESRKTKQELGYQAEKTGVAGSGIEAQMKLSAGQGTQQALAQASATAAANQAAINRRTGEQIAGVSAGIEQEKERAAEAFKQAKKGWKQENIQLGLGAAAAVAGAGLQQSATNQAAFKQAVAGGQVPVGTTYAQYKEMAAAGTGTGGVKVSPSEYGTLRQTFGETQMAEQVGRDFFLKKPGEYESMIQRGWTPQSIYTYATQQNTQMNKGLKTAGLNVLGDADIEFALTDPTANIPPPTEVVPPPTEVVPPPAEVVPPPTEVVPPPAEVPPSVDVTKSISEQIETEEFDPEIASSKTTYGKSGNVNIDNWSKGMSSIDAKKAYQTDPEFKKHIDENYGDLSKSWGDTKSPAIVQESLTTGEQLKQQAYMEQYTKTEPTKRAIESSEDFIKRQEEKEKLTEKYLEKIKTQGSKNITKTLEDRKEAIKKLSKIDPTPKAAYNIEPASEFIERQEKVEKKRLKRIDRNIKSKEKSLTTYLETNKDANVAEATAVSNLWRDTGTAGHMKNLTKKSLGTVPGTDKEIFVNINPDIEKGINELVSQYKSKYADAGMGGKYPKWYSIMMSDIGSRKVVEGKMARERNIPGKYNKPGDDTGKGAGLGGYGGQNIKDDINRVMGKYGLEYYIQFKYDLWRK